ncbi:AraC family transcriptional regulator [Algoriphagus formosus]|uniref:AraC family transcriptional regulator n=1 Tax=Algoriphagus formosus TaxID=2007308 RepID=A0A4R5V8Q0_9BACT|nr:helix-turn-helix domain-containing protein [Algoriphagus aquimaris]TDK47926.1 AraC family transcriptional regulator [Algoriphagus aquimaris]
MKSIPTLKPSTFKNSLMSDYDRFYLDRKYFDDFFIHDLSQQTYKLKLPLPPHRKTVHDLIMLTNGEMVKSSGIDNFKVGSNSIFLLPAGQITTTTNISKNIQGYYLHFSDDYLLRNLNFSFWLSNPVLKIREEETERLKYLLFQLDRIYRQSFNLDLIKAYLNTFLTEIFYLSGSERGQKLSNSEKIVSDFKMLLSEYCKSEHGLEFYSSKLNITSNHLNKCSKMVLNKTASKVISEVLVLEAKVLLYQQKWNISEIAFLLGFEDPSYFGRFFKKYTSHSPSDFLKMIDLSE